MKGYGYGEVTEGDLEYVLEEMRISISRDKAVDAVEEQQQQREGGVDFEEFIEICGNLKDVGVTPSTVLKKERKRILVWQQTTETIIDQSRLLLRKHRRHCGVDGIEEWE